MKYEQLWKDIETLCALRGPSGREAAVREYLIEQIKGHAEYEVDPLGNLLVRKKGKKPAKKVLLLSAHMDEVGFMVTDITSDGYLKFDEVGGLDRRVVLGKTVTVGKNKVNGVIGVKPIHLSKSDERTAVPKYGEMYIDIGATSNDDALSVVSYGDSVNFNSIYENNGYTIKSKAIDDRFGCLALIELIKSELDYDMHFVFAVQEEVGLRGAKVAAYSVDPEFAIVVETTTAADIAGVEETRQVCNLGDGAVISVMDRRTIYDKRMSEMAFECAEETGAKAQYKRAVAGGNDSGVIHQSRGGVKTLAISLPCRYLHSSVTVANVSDCDDIIKIVSALANKIAGGEY